MAIAAVIGLFLISEKSIAQLINGGFEQDDVFSLEGWEWTGHTPQSRPGAPGAGGSWSVTIEPSDYFMGGGSLTQELPWLNTGDVVTISAWLRCTGGSAGCAYVTIQWTGCLLSNPSEEWSFMTCTDTLAPAAGSYLLSLYTLAPGSGIKQDPNPGEFDAISISSSVGIAEHVVPELAIRMDFDSQVLYASIGDRPIRQLRCITVEGKVLTPALSGTGSNTVHFDLSNLSAGIYVLEALTDVGRASVRFLRP